MRWPFVPQSTESLTSRNGVALGIWEMLFRNAGSLLPLTSSGSRIDK